MRIVIFLLLAVSVFGESFTARNEDHTEGRVQIVPVESSPEPDQASLRIVFPELGKMTSSPFIQMRVRGFALGTNTNLPRVFQILNSKMGQTIHIVIDDEPYFAYNGPSMDPFDEEGDFYQQNFRLKIPFSLKDGMHTIRAFLCRSYGESLKGSKCFSAVYFFIKDKKIDRSMSLRTPYLTYNEPSEHVTYSVDVPVLLDFYIRNCELSKDGYKVKLSIDDEHIMDLDKWRPYYIYGLKKGKHIVRLQLLDAEGAEAPGVFNDVKQKIKVR